MQLPRDTVRIKRVMKTGKKADFLKKPVSEGKCGGYILMQAYMDDRRIAFLTEEKAKPARQPVLTRSKRKSKLSTKHGMSQCSKILSA